MTPEKFRAACKKAGLEYLPPDHDVGMPAYWVDESAEGRTYGGCFGWEENDPALLAYVASRLVAMVKDLEYGALRYQPEIAAEVGAGIGFSARALFATDEQRITAAMEVLE